MEELGGAMVAAQAEIVNRRLHGDEAGGGAEAMKGGDTRAANVNGNSVLLLNTVNV